MERKLKLYQGGIELFTVKDVIFYSVFLLAYLLGGAIFISGIFPFRLFHLALISLLMIPLKGLCFGKVEKVFFFFFLEIGVSAIFNHVSVMQFLSFLRFIIVPYSIYFLVKKGLDAKNIRLVLRFIIWIACLQPPVVLLQQTFFETINSILPSSTRFTEDNRIDFSFGTFYVSDDPSMSFFLMTVILFLLFDKRNNYFIKRKMALAGYLTLGVLLSNSQLSNILVVLIWVAYAFRNFRIKDIVKTAVIFGLTILLLMGFGLFDFFQWKLYDVIQQASFETIQNASGSNFQEGKFERTAAVYYYITQPLKVFGDGPSAYYNAVSGEYVLGNNGQVFTLYAEIGVLGLLIGYFIFYVIGKTNLVSRPMFVGCLLLISALTITSFPLTDASIMLTYCIFVKTNLVSNGVPESNVKSNSLIIE
ncbi:MAG: hypothetical protein LCH51_03520 [Bacteroidetes bacterium]|nr:hypothetical protein [Bacteroidota bacterium]